MDREKIIQDILEMSAGTQDTLIRILPAAGVVAGAGYNQLKQGYYKMRKSIARYGKRGKWAKKIAKAKRRKALHMGTGALAGTVGAVGVAVGPSKQTMSHAYKATRTKADEVVKRGQKFVDDSRMSPDWKRRKKRAGTRGHDSMGFQKPPKKPTLLLPSGIREETKEKLVALYSKLQQSQGDKSVSKTTDRVVKFRRPTKSTKHPRHLTDFIQRKIYTGKGKATDDEVKGAVDKALKVFNTPPATKAMIKAKTGEVVRKRSKIDFSGHGRLIKEAFLYGGVGQLRRSQYGPRMKRGSRVRSMFPPRILSTQDRTKTRFSAVVRFKALAALRKQTKFPHKPLAQPAIPIRLREAYKHKLASRDRALAKHGMAPAVDKKAFKKSVKRQVMKIHKQHKNIRRSWVRTRKVSAAADQYAAKHAREWLKEAKMEKKSKLQQVLETYYGQGYNTPAASPNPSPVTTSKSYYTKEKRKGDKTSWNRGYKPSTGTLRARVIDYHQSHRSNVGSALGLGVGAVGGMVAGGVGGYRGGKRVGKDFAELGAIGGMVAGGVVGGVGGSSVGHRLGFKSGTKRGKAINRMIPNRPGVVRKLQTDEPREAKRWFPKQGKEAKKHKKLFYHKDYATKTHTTTASVESGKIKVKQSTSRGKSRRKGSVKTGFAKHGYYREDVIDALAEVFDDTYGKTVTRSAKDQKGKELVHHAKQLKRQGLKKKYSLGNPPPAVKFKSATKFAKAAGISASVLHKGATKLPKKYHRQIVRAYK